MLPAVSTKSKLSDQDSTSTTNSSAQDKAYTEDCKSSAGNREQLGVRSEPTSREMFLQPRGPTQGNKLMDRATMDTSLERDQTKTGFASSSGSEASSDRKRKADDEFDGASKMPKPPRGAQEEEEAPPVESSTHRAAGGHSTAQAQQVDLSAGNLLQTLPGERNNHPAGRSPQRLVEASGRSPPRRGIPLRVGNSPGQGPSNHRLGASTQHAGSLDSVAARQQERDFLASLGTFSLPPHLRQNQFDGGAAAQRLANPVYGAAQPSASELASLMMLREQRQRSLFAANQLLSGGVHGPPQGSDQHGMALLRLLNAQQNPQAQRAADFGAIFAARQMGIGPTGLPTGMAFPHSNFHNIPGLGLAPLDTRGPVSFSQRGPGGEPGRSIVVSGQARRRPPGASLDPSAPLVQPVLGPIGPRVPEFLPVVLALPEDDTKLSGYQLLLRNQIEAFSATPDDVTTHARGRNKPIATQQVGIRCRHCKSILPNQRKKGSVYFPFSLVGLYQAAQNMGSSHFHGDGCAQMSEELKHQFVEVLACKSTVGAGKQYWARAAQKLGLVDTDNGIRFIRDLVPS